MVVSASNDALGTPEPLSDTSTTSAPWSFSRISTFVAPASSAFSTSSLTQLARLRTTWPEHMRCTTTSSIRLMLRGGALDGFSSIGGASAARDIARDAREGRCVAPSASWDGFKRERDDERDAGGDAWIIVARLSYFRRLFVAT